MTKPEVFLTGGDGIGWAVDEDLRLTRAALEGLVELVPLERCDVIHSVWWEGLTGLDPAQLRNKIVVCHVPGEPFRYFGIPAHRRAMSAVHLWVPRSSQAERQLRSVGLRCLKVPYLIDSTIFRPLAKNDPALSQARDQWHIPDDAYLIGNFSRDSEGANLSTPKLVKGPDIFLEIIRGLQNKGARIHVVLAGPRRHWLLAKLHEYSIPFSYAGAPTSEDDIRTNFLPREALNVLYNLLDLYVVPSRSEGGPHAILEASAASCKIISTDVGLARDVLDEKCIYKSVPQAVEIIMDDIETGCLISTAQAHLARVQ
ncbi:MAG: glycosyltransferase family 4 protein, partial [Desulfomonilaceae bacterium]